jgi:hypothetical protein
MAISWNLRPGRVVVTIAAASLFVSLGCRQSEQIQSYNVPKETKVAVATNASNAKPGEPTDRMLAAILPANGQAWFFKIVGPIAQVAKHEKEINEFFAGLTLEADGRARWKVPAGWTEKPGDGFREATIMIPGDKPLQITVNKAGWSGTQENKLANVNRWRGQLQLPDISAPQLSEVSRETKAGERTITIVDMKGQFKSGGMTPPFARGAFGPGATGGSRSGPNQPKNLPEGHPPVDLNPDLPAGHPPVASNLPPGHPPVDATGAPNAAAPAKNEKAANDIPKFTPPASWKQEPGTGMSKVDFVVGDGKQQARVKFIAFPATEGPMIADPLSNINRWRGEVGLEPLNKESLAKASQSIEIDGRPATFAAMIPDTANPNQSKAPQATLAAIARSGDEIWFIKMMGDRDLVASRKDEFKAFLNSIKFSQPGGAVDGNK